MKIIEYHDVSIYNIKEEDFGKTVYLFPEGALVVGKNDLVRYETTDVESALTQLWNSSYRFIDLRLGEYGSESD